MSSRQLTHIETNLLAKDLNFSITSKTLPNKDIKATIEDAVNDLENEETDMIRVKVNLTIQNSKSPKDKLSKDERKTLKELQSETSIVILPADRGRSTAILNREDYFEKCMIIKKMVHINYLKLVSAIFYQNFIFSPNDSPLKTVKNVFYFI